MAQGIKALAVKLDILSSVPGIHTGEEEEKSPSTNGKLGKQKVPVCIVYST